MLEIVPPPDTGIFSRTLIIQPYAILVENVDRSRISVFGTDALDRHPLRTHLQTIDKDHAPNK